jgi:hypothetical protein
MLQCSTQIVPQEMPIMTLNDQHIETMREAPFIIGRFPGLAHELCRNGLMHWADGAWRLTRDGERALAALNADKAA